MTLACPALIADVAPGMCKAVDIYCERTTDALWAEPLNAISNVAFLIAALPMLNSCAATRWGGGSGIVIDAATKEPIAGAHVVLYISTSAPSAFPFGNSTQGCGPDFYAAEIRNTMTALGAKRNIAIGSSIGGSAAFGFGHGLDDSGQHDAGDADGLCERRTD